MNQGCVYASNLAHCHSAPLQDPRYLERLAALRNVRTQAQQSLWDVDGAIAEIAAMEKEIMGPSKLSRSLC